MSARKEPGSKFAFLLPVEKYTDAKGRSRMRAVVGGDVEARDALVKHLEETADAHVETPEETARAKMFSGFGNGRMDASRGSRTKVVYKRGTGWVSNN